MSIETETGGIFSAAKAGTAYFAIMFMAGFALGNKTKKTRSSAKDE